MESNWRYNVYDCGLSLGHWELCARVNVPGYEWLTKYTAPIGPYVGEFLYSSPNWPFFFTTPVLGLTVTGNFPWGYDVLAD